MKDNVTDLFGREEAQDLLTATLQRGARQLLVVALEDELQRHLDKHAEKKLLDGRQRIVRNGHLPQRSIQTGIGNVEVSVPRARDRGENAGEKVQFKSSLIPSYLRKTKSIEELIPWLYLKGISTSAFPEALQTIFGRECLGFSAQTVSRLKSVWEDECTKWRKSDLSKKRYVYWFADGIHCGIRGEDEKMCLLVIIGVTDQGKKELVALNDGYRESSESWLTLLRDLRERGFSVSPKLATGDGALGFWKALAQVFPETKSQRCWQHKSINVLDKLPKALRGQGLEALHEIWMAPTKESALKACDSFEQRFKAKYPNAVECLIKDKENLLTFFNFPAEHWKSLRTTNPIESTFASVRHRSSRAKGCVSRSTMLAFAFKLIASATTRWNKFPGLHFLADVITGINFIDGVSIQDALPSQQVHAA